MQGARGKPLRGWDQLAGQGSTGGRGLAGTGTKHGTPLQVSRPHSGQRGNAVPSAGLRDRLEPRLQPGSGGGEGYGGLQAACAGCPPQGLAGGGREGGSKEAGQGREGGLQCEARSVLRQDLSRCHSDLGCGLGTAGGREASGFCSGVASLGVAGSRELRGDDDGDIVSDVSGGRGARGGGGRGGQLEGVSVVIIAHTALARPPTAPLQQ